MYNPGMAFGAGLAGIGFGSNNNAFNQYNNYMQQGEGDITNYLNQAEGYMSPYRQAGQFGLSGYEGLLGQMSDPAAYYNKIASGYQMSPGAQFRMNTGMDAVKNAMMAQGLGGSGAQAKALTNYTQGVINQDQQNYINQVLGIGRTDLSGYGDLSHIGYGAAGQSGQFAMDAGQDLASMASAEGQAAANQANAKNGSLWGGIGAMVGSL